MREPRHEAKLAARDDLVAPKLADLVRLDDAGFRKLFSGSPVKRTGRDRFIRNVLIAIGNSGEPSLAPKPNACSTIASALVRAMAVWALARLLSTGDFAALRDQRSCARDDDAVRAEWQKA